MNPHEVFRPAIDAIKANPECKHIKCIISMHTLRIIGKYGYISELWLDVNTGSIMDGISFISLNDAGAVRNFVDCIIALALTEEPQDFGNYRAQRKFYKDNFPCLAAEVDYTFCRDEETENEINEMLAGVGPIEQVCPALFHWDLLAFERKVHAALDGGPLPMPIRDEIFSLFAYDV